MKTPQKEVESTTKGSVAAKKPKEKVHHDEEADPIPLVIPDEPPRSKRYRFVFTDSC